MQDAKHRVIHQFLFGIVLLSIGILILHHLIQNITCDFSVVHNLIVDDAQRLSDNFIDIFTADYTHLYRSPSSHTLGNPLVPL